ncbi:MAG: orotate phosphoribosyltransferase [Fidelibacterota bacterium]
MKDEAAHQLFVRTGALLEGHFILSSGRHSATYFQCAKLLQYPEYLEQMAQEIVVHFSSHCIETVVSPAIGGIVIGTEVGRQLRAKTIFAERQEGRMVLRRGFTISPGEKLLIVEDVITTGGSVKEVMELCRHYGGNIIGVGVVVDRSNGTVRLHENQYAVTQQATESYEPDNLPDWLAALPPQKPGSRN